jgi:hypothetical protein
MDIWINLPIGCVESCARRIDTKQIGHAHDDNDDDDDDLGLQELRRKLPVTRTLFSWDKALQLSLSRDLAREFTSKR